MSKSSGGGGLKGHDKGGGGSKVKVIKQQRKQAGFTAAIAANQGNFLPGLQRRRGTGEQELLAPAQRNVLENNHALIVTLDSPSILTLNLLLALNAPELGVLAVGL